MNTHYFMENISAPEALLSADNTGVLITFGDTDGRYRAIEFKVVGTKLQVVEDKVYGE